MIRRAKNWALLAAAIFVSTINGQAQSTADSTVTKKKYQAKAPQTQPFGAKAFEASTQTTLRWLGMAGYFINSRGTTLMIDPLLEGFGVTYGTPTWIWNVAVDSDLYVRAYHGQKSRWYRVALHQKAGHIHAAGMVKEVFFEPIQGPIQGLIDEAYRAKYRNSPYLGSMISERARSATIKIFPVES
jgi:hypothetical protein